MCPFLDNADSRCAMHLTLRNLMRAYAHCADRYAACPVYQQLLTDDRPCPKPCAAARVVAAS